MYILKRVERKARRYKGLLLSGSWSHDDKITNTGARQIARQNTSDLTLISHVVRTRGTFRCDSISVLQPETHTWEIRNDTMIIVMFTSRNCCF